MADLRERPTIGMSFEEEAKLFEEEARAEFAKETGCGDAEGVNNILRRGMRIIQKAREEIAHGVTVQEWISVKDRLPEETDKYLVAYHDYGRWTIRDMWFFTEYKGYELKRGAPCWVVYDSEYGDIDYTKTVTH